MIVASMPEKELAEILVSMSRGVAFQVPGAVRDGAVNTYGCVVNIRKYDSPQGGIVLTLDSGEETYLNLRWVEVPDPTEAFSLTCRGCDERVEFTVNTNEMAMFRKSGDPAVLGSPGLRRFLVDRNCVRCREKR